MRSPPEQTRAFISAPNRLTSPSTATRLSAALLALSLALGGCASTPQPRPAPAPIRLTIVGTNDLHGWVEPQQIVAADGETIERGGLALLSGFLKQVRAANPDGTVLLDAGDMFQGTLASNVSEGAVVIAGYNAIGYDAAALGNHEFDYGPVGSGSVALAPGVDPFGAVVERIRQAQFPMLGRNIYLKGERTRPEWLGNDGTLLLERNGVRVGIVGLITPSTPRVTNPVNVSSLDFGELAPEALEAAESLRARGAEVVIAVVHAGGRCHDLSDPHSLESCDTSGEIFAMLRELPPGTLDGVIAGHTHAHVGHYVNGTPVIESGSYGTRFGILELTFDPVDRKVLTEKTRIRAGIELCTRFWAGTTGCDPKEAPPEARTEPAHFDGAPVAPDPRVAEVLAPYLTKVAEEQQRPLEVAVPTRLTRNQREESPLGNAFADAVRAMENSDASLLNSGGFRADLHAGMLTYGALYEVFPFDNTVATLRVTGEELVAMLEALLSSGHGVPQTSGLTFTARYCGPTARITEIAVGGEPLDPERIYKLTTIDFLALGGDGLGPVLARIPEERKDLGHRRERNMREALAAWLQERGGELSGSVDGRMRLLVDDAPSCAQTSR